MYYKGLYTEIFKTINKPNSNMKYSCQSTKNDRCSIYYHVVQTGWYSSFLL